MIGAEILTQAMFESGTSVVFSLSGNQIMPIYDACLQPGIRIVHVRHESAAVFMADAYAQIKTAQGDLPTYGVALVTAGPGFANALGGLYSALMAESPVILISGDSAVAQDGKRAFQELSQTAAAAPFVKHTVRVTEVDQLEEVWNECISIATTGRPGPVHLAVPFDVLLAKEVKAGDVAPRPETILPSDTEQTQYLAEIYKALSAAKRPVVLTGPSMTASRMQDRFRQLQQVLKMPVIAMESPRGLADPSLGKIDAVIKDADCVLLLGKLPDFTLGFGNRTKVPAETIIVVDANPDSLRQSVSVLAERDSATGIDSQANDLHGKSGIIAVQDDPVAVADAICENYSCVDSHTTWLEYAAQNLTAEPRVSDSAYDAVAAPQSNSEDRSKSRAESSVSPPELTPQQIGDQVQTAVDNCEQSILVCDGGEFGQWAQACVQSDLRVINGPSGAIGGSLPQAVAAKIANPQCVVFAMLGDGTAGFHLAELETSVREKAPIVVIIGNDSRWNAEYQIQLRDYGAQRMHSCELGVGIRYDLAAVGLGCAGEWVHKEAELAEALYNAVQRSQKEGKSTCINVSMSGWAAPVFN